MKTKRVLQRAREEWRKAFGMVARPSNEHKCVFEWARIKTIEAKWLVHVYHWNKSACDKNFIFELSWLPLARYSRSCSWTCLLPRLCLAARSVSICFHYQMLALMLRLDFPVSGGLVEDDHHARSLKDGVFCHLVAVSVHVTFVYRRRHTFYPCAPPPRLPRMAVCMTGWPKFGMSCIPSDVGDCMRLVIAVCPAYGGKTWPDCPSAPGFSFPWFWLVVHQPQISCPEHEHIECRHSGGPALPSPTSNLQREHKI